MTRLAACIGGLALASLLATASPSRAHAQASPGSIALASSITGLEGALGTWVLAMPWGGFWHTSPQADDPWAIVGGLVAGLATSFLTWGLVEGHEARAQLVAAVSGVGAGAALGIAMLGGLYNLLVDFDRLAVALVYGVPILVAMTAGLVTAIVHAIVVGDQPTAMVSPLRVAF